MKVCYNRCGITTKEDNDVRKVIKKTGKHLHEPAFKCKYTVKEPTFTYINEKISK